MAENCLQQFQMYQRCRCLDQETNLTGFRSFIAVKQCSTFSRSPINTRLLEEFDDRIKLQHPDQAADFAAYITLGRMKATLPYPFPWTRACIAATAFGAFIPRVDAQILRDYRCKIERVATAEPPPNSQLDFQAKNYVGKEFTVERRTGMMAGTLKNSYITKPEVIDYGSDENSYKVVTTLRKEQGVGRGSNAYVLVVNEYKKGAAKSFTFVENDEVYFGTCVHF
jgi:hypothetical protein